MKFVELVYKYKWDEICSVLISLYPNDQKNISGFKDEIGNQEVSYGIEFTDWEEWLGMDIDPESTSNYHETDIIAHCPWEMSFYGYTQKAIKKAISRKKYKHYYKLKFHSF